MVDKKTETAKVDPQSEEPEQAPEPTSAPAGSAVESDDTRLSVETPAEDDLNEKLSAAEAKARENHDRVLRVLAEFENYKKRAAKEAADYRKFAHEQIARDLLGVIDNLERALKSASEGSDAACSVVTGVEMILKDFFKILERYYIKPIQAVGENFDPLYHQAVSQVPSNSHKPNTVIEEFQKGYMIHDRLLRPSMVVVSKAAEPGVQPEESEIQPDLDSGI